MIPCIALLLVSCVGDIGNAGGDPIDPPVGPEMTVDPDSTVCGLPPADQPRRLNTTELDTIARDVLSVDSGPFRALGNDYGETVGAYLSTGERFIEGYFDASHTVASEFVSATSLGADCDPTDLTCVKNALEPVVHRLLRRPVTEERLDELAGLVSEAISLDLTFADGMVAALASVMMSPDFFIIGTDVEAAPGMYRLDGYAVAERLALTLWESVPDEALLEAAAAGLLDTDEGIEAQVERMLDDPDKGSRFLDAFVDRNFSLPSGDAVPPGLEMLAEPEALSDDLRTEAQLYLSRAFSENFAASSLVQSESTFINERLANYYGIEGVTGTEFQEVSTVGTARNGGLLTMGGTLARHGDLVHRGVSILNTYYCTPFVPIDSDAIQAALSGLPANPTVRQEIELREGAACAGCHRLIDPLGSPFERFDEAGLLRTEYENGESVVHGLSLDGVVMNTPEDVGAAIVGGNYTSCLSKHLLESVSSRRLLLRNDRVECATEEVLNDLGPEPRLRDIVVRSFLNDLFRNRVVEEE